MFGRKFNVKEAAPSQQGLTTLQNALETGKQPLLANLRWKNSHHCLLVEGIQDGRVFYYNPAGHKSITQLPPESGQRLEKNGLESLPLHEFGQRLEQLILPSD